MNRFIVLDGNNNEIGSGANLKAIREHIGCSRQHMYNELKKTPYNVNYKGVKYTIVDTVAEAWYLQMQKIASQMDDMNNILDFNLN